MAAPACPLFSQNTFKMRPLALLPWAQPHSDTVLLLQRSWELFGAPEFRTEAGVL